jgi:hypothetical protein
MTGFTTTIAVPAAAARLRAMSPRSLGVARKIRSPRVTRSRIAAAVAGGDSGRDTPRIRPAEARSPITVATKTPGKLMTTRSAAASTGLITPSSSWARRERASAVV